MRYTFQKLRQSAGKTVLGVLVFMAIALLPVFIIAQVGGVVTTTSGGGSGGGGDVTTTNSNTFIAGRTQTINGSLFVSNFIGIAGTWGGTNTGIINIPGNISTINRQLSVGNGTNTVDYSSCILYDRAGDISEQWVDRTLSNPTLGIVLDWSNNILGSAWSLTGNWNATGRTNFFKNYVVIGTNIANTMGNALTIDATAGNIPAGVTLVSPPGVPSFIQLTDTPGGSDSVSLTQNGLGLFTIEQLAGQTRMNFLNNHPTTAQWAFQKVGGESIFDINVSGGQIRLLTNITVNSHPGDSTTINGRTVIMGSGALDFGSSAFVVSNNATIGIGTTILSSTNGIHFSGANHFAIQGGRNLTPGNNPGGQLTIQSQGATTNSSNQDAGLTLISSGNATGNGGSEIAFETVGLSQGSGTATRDPTRIMTLLGKRISLGANQTPSAQVEIVVTSTAGADNDLLMLSEDGTGNGNYMICKTNGAVGFYFPGANAATRTVTIGGDGLAVTNRTTLGSQSGGTSFRNFTMTNATIDPGTIIATGIFKTNIVCVGALSNSCVVRASTALPEDGLVYDAHCITNDSVQIRLQNITALGIDPVPQRIEVSVTSK